MSRDAAPPTVVLVPGVGMWPGLFDPVRQRLTSLPHRVWTRPGYDGRPMVTDLDGQADLLADFCDSVGGRGEGSGVVGVGVSGGATLVLATALRHPSALRALLTHEPLVGPLQATLHDRVSAAADLLAGSPEPAAAARFLAGLYGEMAMESIPSEAREWACRHWATVCGEVAQFAAFAPLRSELVRPGPPHVTTVGADSPSERHDVARLLAEHGARLVVLPECGHLAPFHAPLALAEAINDLAAQEP